MANHEYHVQRSNVPTSSAILLGSLYAWLALLGFRSLKADVVIGSLMLGLTARLLRLAKYGSMYFGMLMYGGC